MPSWDCETSRINGGARCWDSFDSWDSVVVRSSTFALRAGSIVKNGPYAWLLWLGLPSETAAHPVRYIESVRPGPSVPAYIRGATAELRPTPIVNQTFQLVVIFKLVYRPRYLSLIPYELCY